MSLENEPAKAFEAGPHHQRLARLCGEWRGTAKTYAEPGAPAHEAAWEGRIASILGGRFVRFSYRSSYKGDPLAGELTLGYELSEMAYRAAWIDSFHTGTGIILSEGEGGDEGGPISVHGTFSAGKGETRWGWRTDIHDEGLPGALVIRMFVVPPGEQPQPGVEISLTAR